MLSPSFPGGTLLMRPGGRHCTTGRWHNREREKWSEHTKVLPALKVGDHVYIQNLVGNYPRRWDRTGIVVEVRQHHQYVVKVDGSGRVTLRNRQHLRKFVPFTQRPTNDQLIASMPPVGSPGPRHPSGTNGQQPPEQPPDDPVSFNPPSDSSADTVPPPPTPPGIPSQESDDTHSRATPLQHEASVQPSSTISHTPRQERNRLPRAVARLLPHNKPGTLECMPARRSCRRSQEWTSRTLCSGLLWLFWTWSVCTYR